ncbi:hypothetical protein [Leptolyngbya sp. NIES-2104]|uniref:hypothetical protein n=1 Tax=Leptolyngbya sp. NIES-2104 TaxID=1552121 RepID=UPI0006EC4E3E|nr:hypothetical protein [Leptolyngbya sp. NIES-2104]GAP95962.1 hypothetical protein NIES2104_24910 [Leptolyngbya sp. NIES-2104]
MNYPISPPHSEPVTEELLLSAIAQVIDTARSQGRSLEEVKAEVLAEDRLLDPQQRHWLSEIVTQAWESLPDCL